MQKKITFLIFIKKIWEYTKEECKFLKYLASHSTAWRSRGFSAERKTKVYLGRHTKLRKTKKHNPLSSCSYGVLFLLVRFNSLVLNLIFSKAQCLVFVYEILYLLVSEVRFIHIQKIPFLLFVSLLIEVPLQEVLRFLVPVNPSRSWFYGEEPRRMFMDVRMCECTV
jgi:hypothetical protein